MNISGYRKDCYTPRDTKRQKLGVGDSVKVLGCLRNVLPLSWFGVTAQVVSVSKYGSVTLTFPTEEKPRTLNKELCAIFLERKGQGE